MSATAGPSLPTDRRRADRPILVEALKFIELTYHTVVRQVRVESGSAALGILSAMARIMLLVMMFYAMYEVLGMRGMVVRGDTILFLVSGILLFFMHNAAVGKVISAGSQVSAMMQHAPMTPTLMILSSALASLYLHIMATGIILSGLYFFKGELKVQDAWGFAAAFGLAWASGVIIGLLFLLLKPFMPTAMRMVSTIYQRANLVTSGKFFVANLLPNAVLPYFAWNPLFHTIDQARGFIFVNYVPNKTSMDYPILFVAIGLVIGLMGEFWLRKTVSRSTAAAH